MWPHKAPYIPGWDVAGIVEAVGDEVEGFAVGDEVYAYHRPEFERDPTDVISANGCLAEYVSVPAHRLARKPASASWSEAAGLPLAGLTAYQGLHDHLKLVAGSSVLITGGSGGVGGLAVQLAKAAGLTVVATCSAKNVAYVAGLGADVVIDYGAGDVAAAVLARFPGGVDAVLDTIGGDAALAGLAALKAGGPISSTAHYTIHEEAAKAGKTGSAYMVSPSRVGLDAMAALFDAGKLKSATKSFAGLESAQEAFAESIGGRTVGKLVVDVQ